MESTPKIDASGETKGAAASKSTISFPYSDQDASIEVARGVHNGGGNACDLEQLAAQLKMEAKGGGFRLRINAASAFGLVVYERGGRVTLTPLGRQILDPSTQRRARVDSFLNVDLYQKVYDEFKGGPLPPQAALQRAIVKMGVGAKVADRARIALMRSAKQAGFFESAADRLVKPPIRQEAPEEAQAQEQPPGTGGGGFGGGGSDQHPLIAGLLMTLPTPGEEWSVEERLNWLTMANSIFKAIYPRVQQDTESADVKIEMKNKEPKT